MPPVISGVSLGQLVGVLAGQELAEDVVADDGSRSRAWRPPVGQARSAQPVAEPGGEQGLEMGVGLDDGPGAVADRERVFERLVEHAALHEVGDAQAEHRQRGRGDVVQVGPERSAGPDVGAVDGDDAVAPVRRRQVRVGAEQLVPQRGRPTWPAPGSRRPRGRGPRASPRRRGRGRTGRRRRRRRGTAARRRSRDRARRGRPRSRRR